jgi:hypothetical protein
VQQILAAHIDGTLSKIKGSAERDLVRVAPRRTAGLTGDARPAAPAAAAASASAAGPDDGETGDDGGEPDEAHPAAPTA